MSSRKVMERGARRPAGLSLFRTIVVIAVAAAVAFHYFLKPRHKS